ncbi:hypothetical protein ACL02S_03070 [Nocardia sp. 004]|uniref:hypothetical protein n=1 Tax=Nocardia sp. 004 TaxID=3385978 RepID=UPI0039A0DA96
MRYKKLAATALLAVAATGVTAGTGYAAPAPPVTQDRTVIASKITGSENGVDYVLELADTGKSVVAGVTGGAFRVDADRQSVIMTNSAGEVLTTIPLTMTAGGQQVRVAAEITDADTRLMLTPQLTPTADAPSTAEFVGAQEWFFAELQRASLGALVGGLIGGLIGLVFFVIGVVPGAALGALIGLAVAGGPSLLNAGIAYFSGQP